MEVLYASAARNFLLLNVPTVDRAPLNTAQGVNATTLEAAAIADWNARLDDLAEELRVTHESAAHVFERGEAGEVGFEGFVGLD